MRQVGTANPLRRTGFTLIELLVVIAIISILAAILFPVFAEARQKGRQTACLSNLRQIGMALQMYADEHEWYPWSSFSVSNSAMPPVVTVTSWIPIASSTNSQSNGFDANTDYFLKPYLQEHAGTAVPESGVSHQPDGRQASLVELRA